MELQEFVSRTLISVVEGVIAAQAKYDHTGDERIINPPVRAGSDAREVHVRGGLAPQSVEFDVAVTASESTETKGGIGIHVGAFGLGSQGKSDAANTSVSRIRFTVPIMLPLQKA